MDNLFNVLPRTIYVLVIFQVLQSYTIRGKCRWHRHSCSLLANWYHNPQDYPCKVRITSFPQLLSTSNILEFRGTHKSNISVFLLDSKLLFTRHLTSVIHKATGIFLQHSPSSHATQHCLYPIKSLCTNYVSALYSHKLPLYGATHHLSTIADYKFYSPNVSALLANIPGAPTSHVFMPL